MNLTPLVPNFIGDCKIRARSPDAFRRLSLPGAIQEIQRIWNLARRKGSSCLGKADFSLAAARTKVVQRVGRVLEVIPLNDTRWVSQGVHNTFVMEYPLACRAFVLNRLAPTSAKTTDTFLQSCGIRSNTKWCMDFFICVKWVAMEYGASIAQAQYIAAASTIDVLCVSVGINPGVGVPGQTPAALGFFVPNTLPTTFRLRRRG